MVSRNYHVTVLDNLSRGSKENVSRWLASPNFEFVLADLLDESNFRHEEKSGLQQTIDNSDIIFHFAANPDVVVGADNTRIDFRQNVQATFNLLEAIRKSQLKLDQNSNSNRKNTKQLIFASSSTVYGEADKGLPQRTILLCVQYPCMEQQSLQKLLSQATVICLVFNA
jgi:UDP-glucose 4-epimerase